MVQFSSIAQIEREIRGTPELSACLRKKDATCSTLGTFSHRRCAGILAFNRLYKKLLISYFPLLFQAAAGPRELELQRFNSQSFIQVSVSQLPYLIWTCSSTMLFQPMHNRGWHLSLMITLNFMIS